MSMRGLVAYGLQILGGQNSLQALSATSIK